MSFSLIEFIFIQWVGCNGNSFGYSEILILNPQVKNFQKIWYTLFSKNVFLEGKFMAKKIEFLQWGKKKRKVILL